jgi:uncharacterized damage-inducible protein DinB
MEPSEIMDLIGYHEWATQIILDTAGQLPEEQFTKTVDTEGGPVELRRILVHMLDEGIGWRQVLQGLAQPPALLPEDFADISLLRRAWAAERAQLLAYLRELSAEDLNAECPFQTGEKPAGTRLVWQILLHIVNHGTQHRSEAALLMAAMGCNPGELDFTYYLDQRE